MAKKAVVYIRVSSDSQEDNTSLDEQERRAKAYINSQGWKLLKTYRDVASGKNVNRPGLKALLKDKDEYDSVVVLKLDRLSRKLLDTLHMIEHDFSQNNVSVVSVTESFDTSTAQGRLFVSMLGGFAEYEREMISERVKRGKELKAKDGGYIGGAPRFGKKAKDKELVEDNVELNIIRAIKRQKKKGNSLRQIADFLDKKGYPTKRGGKWQASTISQILKRDNRLRFENT